MGVGTKSLLFGVHQFAWHPFTVLLAWQKLYGWPNWKELVCIVIHDWGYWGSPNMDGPEGEKHPVRSALIIENWLGHEYGELIRRHSRHYCRMFELEPSKLCWADKLSILYERWWTYIPRAMLSGELKEYRLLASNGLGIDIYKPHRYWFKVIQEKFRKLAAEQRGDAIPYVNPEGFLNYKKGVIKDEAN